MANHVDSHPSCGFCGHAMVNINYVGIPASFYICNICFGDLASVLSYRCSVCNSTSIGSTTAYSNHWPSHMARLSSARICTMDMYNTHRCHHMPRPPVASIHVVEKYNIRR
ncbi:hypothetical protein ABZP36_034214 [Zizania latifolia]